MSDDDPYADLPRAAATSPSAASLAPKKRLREEEVASSAKKAASSDSRRVAFREDHSVAREDVVQDIPAKAVLDPHHTIEKLKGYMLVDKKFTKAAALFGAFLEEQCTATSPDKTTLSLLLSTVQEVMNAKPERIHHASYRAAYSALLRLVDRHRAPLLLASDNFDSDIVDNWVLDVVVHNELFTDDTYLFAKAAKQVAAHITDRRDEAVSMENLADVAALDRVLLPCLRSLMARHGTAWAKTSVEMVLGLCTARRLTFSDTDRIDVDEWTSRIHQRKAAPTSWGKHSAAAEMRKNIVAYNDTQTGVKVGKSNHPLFNKDS